MFHRRLNPTDKAIWFGILVLMVAETGLIAPPVSDALRVVLLVFFPVLSLFLVRWEN